MSVICVCRFGAGRGRTGNDLRRDEGGARRRDQNEEESEKKEVQKAGGASRGRGKAKRGAKYQSLHKRLIGGESAGKRRSSEGQRRFHST